jgi:DNA polymerase III epsilon subunit-like protein
MIVLIFDTETTGLPLTKTISKDLLDKWPYIVQLSYILYDTEKCMSIYDNDCIIRLPNEIEIPLDSTKIHGITTEISHNQGFDIQVVMEQFIRDWEKAHLIVAHNISFDLNMIQVELLRLSSKNLLKYTGYSNKIHKSTNLYCTMQESINLCNLVTKDKYGRDYVKFPKLSELHETLFSTTPSNLHNSFNDVIVCLRCFYKLKFDKDIIALDRDIKEIASTLNMF